MDPCEVRIILTGPTRSDYLPCIREGNVFILSVYVFITFEYLDLETSFLVSWYILTISGSSLSSLGQGRGHFDKMGYSDCQRPNSFTYSLYDIAMVTKVKVISRPMSFLSQTLVYPIKLAHYTPGIDTIILVTKKKKKKKKKQQITNCMLHSKPDGSFSMTFETS